MTRSPGSDALVAPPSWASKVWLRVGVLSYWHVVAWVVFATVGISGYWASLEAGANAAEQRRGQELAQAMLAQAEEDFALVEKLLRQTHDLPHAPCSPQQIDALNRLDFDVSEVKEFGVFDALGRLVCTSRSGVLAVPREAPPPDSTYGDVRVNASVVPLFSQTTTAYVMQRGTLNALMDPKRWVSEVDGKQFAARITDAQSGKEVARQVDDSDHPRHYQAKGSHFVVYVDATGAYAEQWLQGRRTWVLPVLVAVGVLAGLIAWLVVSRARTPMARLERVIYFRPENVTLVYQPIVGIDRAQIVGVEALLRLRAESGKAQPAAAVFGLLEREAVLSRRLTVLVLDKALQELRGWLAQDPTRFLAVNVTQHDLDNDDLPGVVRALLQRHGVLAAQVHLELLETTRLASERSLRVLQALRKLGCELWIDDFGVGYSNLARLHTLPVHGVKLDREWVEALDDSQHVRTDGVTHLVLFAGSNGLDIVAEGVSDELAMRTLMRLGVQQMQGFLFAPGLPAKELLHLSDSPISVGSPRTMREELDRIRA